MTAALRSPATPPLEDEDLLSEILLRLPPQPSSLPRASVVCKRWLSLVSDPRFVRRFRLRHRHNPSVLGFFRGTIGSLRFQPTMEPPNRVQRGRFSSPIDDGDGSMLLGCRHGLVLIFHSSRSRDQVLVWDPVAGVQRRIATPLGFDMQKTPIAGAVLRAAGDNFKVVLVGYKEKNRRVDLCFYSSETGVWSNIISTRISRDAMGYAGFPAVLVGDSLYWLLPGDGDPRLILEADLARQSLAVMPMDMFAKRQDLMVMRAEGGGLGLLSLSECTVQLWKRNADCDRGASWVLGRTIEMGRLLSQSYIRMLGYAEENNVAFFRTVAGIFMVQLHSSQFSKLPEKNDAFVLYPFESVYAAETSIGGGHDGAHQHMLA